MASNGKPITQTGNKSNALDAVPVPKSSDTPNGVSNGTPIVSSVEKPTTPANLKTKHKGIINSLDHFMLRLNKLLTPMKDVGSILTTFNYTLYLLAYLDAKLSSFRGKIVALVSPTSRLHGTVAAESSSFAKLGSLIYETRTTLRLFGLIPLYARARELMQGRKPDEDRITYLIEVLRCAFDTAFHLLENVAFLIQHGVLSSHFAFGKRVSSLYTLAHRAWFVGVSLKLVSLFRYAQLEFRKSVSDNKGESGGWTDLIVPLAWLPLSWQLAGWTESAFSDSHLGIHGVIGVLMDLGRTEKLWEATKDV